MTFEAPYIPEEPSPWWLKGLAVFMALISIFMLFSVASGALTPVLVDRLLPDDFEEIEPYPEEGTDEEKEEWEISKSEWDTIVEYMGEMMGLLRFQAAHSGILAIIGLLSVPVLWRGDRDLGIKLVGAWIGVNILGGMGLMWMMSRIGFMPDFDSSREVEGFDPEIMEPFYLLMGWGQIIACNICFLGILGLVANKSKPPTRLVSAPVSDATIPPQS